MDKITLIISNLVNSVQVIVDVLINLIFQPVFALITIVQSLIEIWSGDENEEVSEDVNEGVKVYPSTNEGRYPEECEYPIGRQRIGFRQSEVDEIKRIKEELNKK